MKPTSDNEEMKANGLEVEGSRDGKEQIDMDRLFDMIYDLMQARKAAENGHQEGDTSGSLWFLYR